MFKSLERDENVLITIWGKIFNIIEKPVSIGICIWWQWSGTDCKLLSQAMRWVYVEAIRGRRVNRQEGIFYAEHLKEAFLSA